MKEQNETIYLYRYDDPLYYLEGRNKKPSISRFIVCKQTPCGYWIYGPSRNHGGRWISKEGKKRYAYPTEAEALESYACRKRRQLGIHKAIVRDAEHFLACAEAMQRGE